MPRIVAAGGGQPEVTVTSDASGRGGGSTARLGGRELTLLCGFNQYTLLQNRDNSGLLGTPLYCSLKLGGRCPPNTQVGGAAAPPAPPVEPPLSGNWGCGAYSGQTWFMLPWLGPIQNLVYYSIVHTILPTHQSAITPLHGFCACTFMQQLMLEYILHPTLMQEHQ